MSFSKKPPQSRSFRSLLFQLKSTSFMIPTAQIVVVGDGTVGKTSILTAYTSNSMFHSTSLPQPAKLPDFNDIIDHLPNVLLLSQLIGHHEKYEPTIFDNYHTHTLYNGEPLALALMDTAGQEDYDHLRTLSYPNTDLFLVCFSVVSPHSYENVRSRWLPELQKNCPGVPILLVGTKSDLRENNDIMNILHAKGLQMVTAEQGEAMAKLIGAIGYVECSALTMDNIKTVFDTAINGLMKNRELKKKRKRGTKCCIM